MVGEASLAVGAVAEPGAVEALAAAAALAVELEDVLFQKILWKNSEE